MAFNKTVLAKLITEKCGTPKPVAEIAAEEMIRDDFPQNGIGTMGQAIAYLDRLHDLMRQS
jgi:hypothetical protein